MRIWLHGAVWVAAMLVAAVAAPAVQAQTYVRVTVTINGVRTTVLVPDGGSASLGGYSAAAEGRSEFGAPVLGKVPYISRGFRNVGYGRRMVYRRVIASVRVIDLREEEYRQTGVRSR
jgi:type II secretory pathway component GspD/PulD (secretin)